MSQDFKMVTRKENGNLYVDVRGDFDGSSAWELIRLLEETFKGKGRVVIDTGHLQTVSPFGASTFRVRLNKETVPAVCLVFKGARATEIAIDGSRIEKKTGKETCLCNGKCRECHCKDSDAPSPAYKPVERMRGTL